MADPMADAADMADPMADAEDIAADAADADAVAADAANPAAAADLADASDPNGIADSVPYTQPIAHGPGGLQTDVADPDGIAEDGPQIPESPRIRSQNGGKNGMLGKLMVSIMEKLGNGEPIKMIVDVKNPAAMISKQ